MISDWCAMKNDAICTRQSLFVLVCIPFRLLVPLPACFRAIEGRYGLAQIKFRPLFRPRAPGVCAGSAGRISQRRGVQHKFTCDYHRDARPLCPHSCRDACLGRGDLFARQTIPSAVCLRIQVLSEWIACATIGAQSTLTGTPVPQARGYGAPSGWQRPRAAGCRCHAPVHRRRVRPVRSASVP